MLLTQVGSKTPAMLQRLSLNRMRDIAGKGNASQPLEDIPIAKLLERLDTALVSADPWKASIVLVRLTVAQIGANACLFYCAGPSPREPVNQQGPTAFGIHIENLCFRYSLRGEPDRRQPWTESQQDRVFLVFAGCAEYL